MKVTETIERECCASKDLRTVEGSPMLNSARYPKFKFCVHCGARHEYTSFMDAAGSTDWEYRKLSEPVRA